MLNNISSYIKNQGSHYKNLIVIVFLLLWTTVTQLFLNYDSPLHYSFGHIDSSWFFMCGKAWMNGLIPYVDFSDSKGPLLWLIYGIGYLISPHGFEGIYILACFYYTAILWYCYKIGLLFLNGSRRLSFLAAAIMVIPYFCWLDFEVRAESWCQLSLIYCIYRLCVALLNPTSVDSKNSMLTMGMAIGAVALIKWNIAVLYSFIPILICFFPTFTDIQRVKKLLVLISCFICGFVITCLPIVVLLFYYGAINDCIHEYIFTTTATISNDMNSSWRTSFATYYNDALKFITSSRMWSIVFVACTLPLFHQIKGFKRYVPFIIGIILIAGLHIHDMRYYQMAGASMGIFLMIMVCNSIHTYYHHLRFRTLFLLLMSVLIGCAVSILRTHVNIRYLSTYAPVMAEIEYNLPSTGHPTILNYYSTETAIGITKEYLPVSKYWSYQAGSIDEIVAHQDSVLLTGTADVVTLLEYLIPSDKRLSDVVEHISEAGYEPVGSFKWIVDDGLSSTQHVFRRKESSH